MKSKYLLTLGLLFSLLLLSACGSTGGERGFRSGSDNTDEFLVGTKGVTFKLEDQGTLTIPKDEKAFLVLIAENEGNYNTVLDFLVSGADDNFLDFDNNPSEGDPTLNGRSRYGKGDQGYFSWESGDAGVPPGAKILNQPTTINICYDYETFVQVPVRINLLPEINKDIPSEFSVGTSQGQGGPVGVNNVKIKSYRKSSEQTRVVVDFTLAQFDSSNNGEVYMHGGEDPCSTSPSVRDLIQEKGTVLAETRGDGAFKLSNVEMDCPAISARDGKIDITRTPVVTCIADLDRSEFPGAELNTILTGKLFYRMRNSVTKNIVIENLDEV